MRLDRRGFLMGSAAVLAAPRVWAQQGGRAAEVHVGTIQDIVTLDPANYRARATQNVVRNIHDGLLTRSFEHRRAPEVASSWSQLDATTYEFTLHQGIRFHSGDPLTAEDVAFSFNRLVQENAMEGRTSPRKGLLGPLENAEVVDPHTVRLHLARPWAYFPDYLPIQEIVNRRQIERVGHDGFQEQPDGCGPFRFVEWRRGEAVILERFDGYFGGSRAIPPVGPAAMQRAIFRVVPDASARLAGLLTGELDIIQEVQPSDVAQIEASGRAQVLRVNGSANQALAMNVGKWPLDDVRVRRALSHAVDRDQIIQQVLGGNASKLVGPLAHDDHGFNPDLEEYAYDLDRAKALLAEAGVPEGTELVIDTIASRREEAEILSAFLSRTGLRVRPQIWEGAVLQQTWQNPETRRERDIQYAAYGNSAKTTEILVGTLRTGGPTNSTGYSDPETDREIDAMNAAADEESRLAHARAAQARVVDQAPWVFLWVAQDLYGMSRRLTGWHPQADGRINLHRVRLAG